MFVNSISKVASLCMTIQLLAIASSSDTTTENDVSEPNRVFLTGGSGYLGRNIIRHYVAKGVPVHALARSVAAKQVVESLGAIGFLGDLSELGAMQIAARGCDVVIHSAAYVKMWGDLDTARAVTVEGTRNVIIAAASEGVRRVIHVGTEAGCVTSSGAPLVNLAESTPLPDVAFAGVYSTTKNEAEKAALQTGIEHGVDVVVVRPRLIWGRDDTVFLPKLVEAANTGVLAWFDGGEYKQSTVHVVNVVEGIEKAIARGTAGASYFITDGDPVVFKDFASSLLRSVSVEPPTKSVPFWLMWYAGIVVEGVCSVVGCEPPITRQALVLIGQEITVSDAKARTEIGYVGHMSIEAGVAEMRVEFQGAKITVNVNKRTPEETKTDL
eukprot:m.24612 g.24612  ORF g.24612 m.24612 type:complete len:383 (+) comp14677_c0_seq1:218-1366(+)